MKPADRLRDCREFAASPSFATKEPALKRLIRACSSTIGKKFVIAVTGLLLCGFLVVHLAGNLLLYVGPKAYNDYAHSLHEKGALLAVAEIGLLVLFLVHLFFALQITRDNWTARKHRYRLKVSKIKDRQSPVKPENFMIVSGLVVLGFILLHLADMRFAIRPDITYSDFGDDEAARTIAVLATPLSAFGYTLGVALLGLHLGHGFASSFQSLGLNHPKYAVLIHWVGVIFAAVIAIGFVSFPVVYFLQK
jgi:succinate dehydrogenase cytochrome b subunit